MLKEDRQEDRVRERRRMSLSVEVDDGLKEPGRDYQDVNGFLRGRQQVFMFSILRCLVY